VLFLGRIIDGVTGGNFSILFAYMADRTTPDQRGALFGRVGAVAGLGFLLGPAIGGFAARWGYEAPAYLAGGIALCAMLWGFFVLPESLGAEQRVPQVRIAALNAFTALRQLLAIRRWAACFRAPPGRRRRARCRAAASRSSRWRSCSGRSGAAGCTRSSARPRRTGRRRCGSPWRSLPSPPRVAMFEAR